MTETMIVSICTLAGTALTAFVSLRKYSNLTDYRMDELTRRVEKHNNFMERLAITEKEIVLLCEKIKVANHRISDLEEKKGGTA